MNKDEWQKLYEALSKIHSDFVPAYSKYKHGSNKQKRKAGESDVDSTIRLARTIIANNTEAYLLLTGEHGNEYSRAIKFDEFVQPHYFGGDLYDFLKKIKGKIDFV